MTHRIRAVHIYTIAGIHSLIMMSDFVGILRAVLSGTFGG